MEISEPNIGVWLWRSHPTNLGPGEYYADILIGAPGDRDGSMAVHTSVITKNMGVIDRRIFYIPDVAKLTDASAKDPSGYDVLKHLATNKVKVYSGLPKLLLYTGVAYQSIQPMLNPFHVESPSITLALSKDVLIKCATMIGPEGSKHGRLTPELLADPISLQRWTWDVDLKDWPDPRSSLNVGLRGADQLVPVWA